GSASSLSPRYSPHQLRGATRVREVVDLRRCIIDLGVSRRQAFVLGGPQVHARLLSLGGIGRRRGRAGGGRSLAWRGHCRRCERNRCCDQRRRDAAPCELHGGAPFRVRRYVHSPCRVGELVSSPLTPNDTPASWNLRLSWPALAMLSRLVSPLPVARYNIQLVALMTADPNLRAEFGAGILGAFRWCRRGSHEALPGGPEVRLSLGDYDTSQHVEAVGAEGIRINSIAAAQVDTLLSGV